MSSKILVQIFQATVAILACACMLLAENAEGQVANMPKKRSVINPETAIEAGMYCTTKLTVRRANGRKGSGTGFFFRIMMSENTAMDIILTNKHVVRGAVEGVFRIHLADQQSGKPSGNLADVTLDKFEKRWVNHPLESVDLCAMPIVPLNDAIAKKGGRPFYAVLNEDLIRTDAELLGLSAVEDLIMIGYPRGLSDELNNYPIFRRGITATHAALDHNGESYTLVDVACFPGSSGSPILIPEPIAYEAKVENARPTGTILLGILSKGPVYNKQGVMSVEEIPVYEQENVLPMIPIHLGYAIRAKEILVLAERLKQLEESGELKNYIQPVE